MTRMTTIVVVMFGSLLLPLASADAAVLYAADGAGGANARLFTIDPANGAVTSTVGGGGPIGFSPTGMAVHPLTGDLHGSTGNQSNSPGSLIRIDKATGQGTLIGSLGIPGHTMADITFASNGTLYGWAEPTRDALHVIDLATGRATRVGNSTFPANTFGSGLAASADVLFFTGRGGLGPLSREGPTNGAALNGTALNWQLDGPVNALAFGPGGLYGLGLSPLPGDFTTFLLRIDPATGHVTVLGETIPFGDALAFDPPSFPATPAPPPSIPTLSDLGFAVLAALLAGLAVRQVRRGARR